MSKSFSVKNLVLGALFLALTLLLPFLTGQIPQIGSMLSPMHLPVLLAGFVCGGPVGAVVGFIAPPLRYLLFGMPPIYPTGLAMAFELLTYGLVSGLVYNYVFKKRSVVSVYASLVAAMLAGRVVWGVARLIMAGIATNADPFTFTAFLSGAFINAVPAIIVQLILVPVIVLALQEAKLIEGPTLAH